MSHPAASAVPLALAAFLACWQGAIAGAADLDCPDFRTQEEAQAYFERIGGSPSYNADLLDSDGDGVACELNPSGADGAVQRPTPSPSPRPTPRPRPTPTRAPVVARPGAAPTARSPDDGVLFEVGGWRVTDGQVLLVGLLVGVPLLFGVVGAAGEGRQRRHASPARPAWMSPSPARTANRTANPPKADAYDTRTMPYRDYLQTPEWQATRGSALRRAGYRCQLCNGRDGPLDVHHRTYARRGNEAAEDVIVLCRTCHALFHARRGTPR